MLELVAQKQREREEREGPGGIGTGTAAQETRAGLSAARQRLQEDEMRAAEKAEEEKAEELEARSGFWECWLRYGKGIKVCFVNV